MVIAKKIAHNNLRATKHAQAPSAHAQYKTLLLDAAPNQADPNDDRGFVNAKQRRENAEENARQDLRTRIKTMSIEEKRLLIIRIIKDERLPENHKKMLINLVLQTEIIGSEERKRLMTQIAQVSATPARNYNYR